MIFIPLPAPFPQPASHGRNLPAAILTGILGLAWAILLIGYVINSFLSAGHLLDATFAAMGFNISSYLLAGRQYIGKFDDRKTTAHFNPGHVLQNPIFEIRVETKINQNMAIGRGRPLLGCRDCAKIESASFPLENIQIFAQDSNWARTTLNDPTISGLITRLMDESDGAGSREIYIQPGSIWLHSRPSVKFEGKNVKEFLELLLKLANIIEKAN